MLGKEKEGRGWNVLMEEKKKKLQRNYGKVKKVRLNNQSLQAGHPAQDGRL